MASDYTDQHSMPPWNEPQQEPEGDDGSVAGDIGDRIMDNVRALVRCAEKAEARVRGLNRLADQLNEGLDARIEQLRELREAARVQPRRVGEAEWKAAAMVVARFARRDPQVLMSEDYEEAKAIIAALGIEITPEGGDDRG